MNEFPQSLLVADTSCREYPSLLGLEEVDFCSQPWLEVKSSASEAREYARQQKLGCVWVVSSDDMEALNLAAAIRRDSAALPIYLVSEDASGSALSRAERAGITAMRNTVELKSWIVSAKAQHGLHEDRRLADGVAAAEMDVAQIDQQDVDEPPVFAKASSKTLKPDGFSSDAGKDAASGEARRGNPGVAYAADRASTERANQANFKESANPAYLITVLSGSGGAGKSTVATVAAHMAQDLGHRTLLFDCDLQFGDVASMCGLQNAPTADDVLEDPDVLENAASEALAQGLPCVLAAPKRLESADILAPHIPKILEEASGLFDVIVANTGSSWAECHAVLLERSALPLFLIDQRGSSVRACQHALELCGRLGMATGQFAYAVNRCERGALFTSLDVGCAMQGGQVFEIKEGGREVEELLGAGLASQLARIKNDLCESVGQMLEQVLPSVPKQSRKKVSKRRRGKRLLKHGTAGVFPHEGCGKEDGSFALGSASSDGVSAMQPDSGSPAEKEHWTQRIRRLQLESQSRAIEEATYSYGGASR